MRLFRRGGTSRSRGSIGPIVDDKSGLELGIDPHGYLCVLEEHCVTLHKGIEYIINGLATVCLGFLSLVWNVGL